MPIMKILISHAAVDSALANKFAELLQLGIGVPRDNIFFSSSAGSIPNGEYFVEHIIKELQAADLVISILSREYFKSEFCLAEVGAAQLKRAAGQARFWSFIVPPVSFSDLGGVLYGVQSGSILDEEQLSELRDEIAKSISNPHKTSIWDEKRKAFLQTASQTANHYKASDTLAKLAVHDVFIETAPSSTTGIIYKNKLRVVLLNDASDALDVVDSNWKSGRHGVRLQNPPVDPLLWQIGGAGKESTQIHVPSGKTLHTYIGLHGSVTEKETLRRSATKSLGVLELNVTTLGVKVAHKITL